MKFRISKLPVSLKIKFTLITVSVGLISFGMAVLQSNRWMAREFEKYYKEKAFLVWTHIIDDLEDAMISGNHAGIPKVLNLYRQNKEVKEVRVFDLKAREAFAENQVPTRARVEETLTTGSLVEFDDEIEGKRVASFIIPIKNRPACYGCHDQSSSLRGALLLSLSLQAMEKDLAQGNRRFWILFGLVAIAIITSTIVSVNRLFLRPLNRIHKGTEAIEKGDFQYRIPVDLGDEIGSLTKSFNHMARTLNDKNAQLMEQLALISRSQKEWQETFDNITDMIAVINKDFNIVRANRAFLDHFYLSELEALKNHVQVACNQIALAERRPITNELPDGRTGKIFQVSLFPYSSPDGEFMGSILIAKDISEKKENEMRQIMSERLVALGQMASGVAHEINNPLATIAACAEGLLKRLGKGQLDPSLFESYLKIIDEEIARCKGITTSMLSFVRKAGDEKKDIQVHEVLEKTLDMIGFLGRLKGVEVLKNFEERMPMVHGNEGELRQVFQTIIINALDAMEDKGKLTVATYAEERTVLIKISDTGPGIPTSLVHRIFDPFFSTKLERGGNGLGLSIATKLVKEHDGKIEVLSEEGKGTTFTITLPV